MATPRHQTPPGGKGVFAYQSDQTNNYPFLFPQLLTRTTYIYPPCFFFWFPIDLFPHPTKQTKKRKPHPHTPICFPNGSAEDPTGARPYAITPVKLPNTWIPPGQGGGEGGIIGFSQEKKNFQTLLLIRKRKSPKPLLRFFSYQ